MLEEWRFLSWAGGRRRRRYQEALEAIYTQHEERQKERIRAIRSSAGQGSVAERVKQVSPILPFGV